MGEDVVVSTSEVPTVDNNDTGRILVSNMDYDSDSWT